MTMSLLELAVGAHCLHPLLIGKTSVNLPEIHVSEFPQLLFILSLTQRLELSAL